MAIAFVQENDFAPGAPGTTVAVTFTGAVTAGDFLCCGFGWDVATGTVISVKDNINNINWTLGILNQGTSVTSGIYYYPVSLGASAGTMTVTLTISASSPAPFMLCYEFSGVATSLPIDQSIGTNLNSTGPAAPGNVTLTNVNDLLFSSCTVTAAVSAGNAGWTTTINATTGCAAQYRIAPGTTGPFNPNYTLTGSSNWSATQVAFFPASPGGATTTGLVGYSFWGGGHS